MPPTLHAEVTCA